MRQWVAMENLGCQTTEGNYQDALKSCVDPYLRSPFCIGFNDKVL